MSTTKKKPNRYSNVPIIIESTNKNGDCSEILKQGFKIVLNSKANVS